jgi:hypothetical protein
VAYALVSLLFFFFSFNSVFYEAERGMEWWREGSKRGKGEGGRRGKDSGVFCFLISLFSDTAFVGLEKKVDENLIEWVFYSYADFESNDLVTVLFLLQFSSRIVDKNTRLIGFIYSPGGGKEKREGNNAARICWIKITRGRELLNSAIRATNNKTTVIVIIIIIVAFFLGCGSAYMGG